MRLSLLSHRVPFLKPLIVVLLIANLFVGGAQIVLADNFEGGNPPPLANGVNGHLGCANLSDGQVRVFKDLHQTYGTNHPSDACTPNEYPIVIFFAHN